MLILRRLALIALVACTVVCSAQPRPSAAVLQEVAKASSLPSIQAIPKIEHALRLAEKTKDLPGQVFARIVLGANYREINQRAKAIQCLEVALIQARQLKWQVNELAALRLLAVCNSDLGQQDQALPYIEQGLALATTLKDEEQAIWCLQDLGAYHINTGDPAKGRTFYRQSLERAIAAKSIELEARARTWLSLVNALLGELGPAVSDGRIALDLARKSKNRSLEGKALQHLAYAQSRLNRNDEAVKLYDQAIAIFDSIGDEFSSARALIYEAPCLLSIGRVSRAAACYQRALNVCKAGGDLQGMTAALQNIAQMAIDAGDFQAASSFFQAALELAGRAQDRNAEAIALTGLGRMYLTLQDYLEAADFLSKALAELAAVGNADARADALFLLQQAYVGLKADSVAILWGKQMINQIQALRKSVRSLGQEIVRTYSASYADRYRSLADLLAANGRIAEAQQVLGLLKDEEFFRYLDVRSGATSEQVDLTPVEKAWLEKYTALDKNISEIAAEYDRLRKIEPAKRTPAQAKALTDAREKLDAAGAAFRAFIASAKSAFATAGAGGRIDDIASVQALNRTLAKLPGSVVAISTLATSDGVRMILSMPSLNVPRQAKQSIKFDDLNRKILAFRQACQDPSLDPRPLGAELYDLLVRPIEQDLKGAHADLLIWSLDSTLRYLPIWALYDKDSRQFLIEKYPCSVFTPRTIDRLAESPSGTMSGAAFGVTKPHTVDGVSFDALPSVAAEINAVGGLLGTTGQLDDRFTIKSLRDGIDGGAHILHIATHFRFRSGDDVGSYLLLGDGTAFTVEQFKNLADGSLANVDLLVLSACETAMGTVGADGSEFESFGLLAQTKGAGAVMASLWPVNDDSTAILMSEFYRLKKAHPEWTKIACLRAAQLAMLTGTSKIAVGSGRRANSGASEGNPDLPKWELDPKRPYSHPFYWAPFVLIGNWK